MILFFLCLILTSFWDQKHEETGGNKPSKMLQAASLVWFHAWHGTSFLPSPWPRSFFFSTQGSDAHTWAWVQSHLKGLSSKHFGGSQPHIFRFCNLRGRPQWSIFHHFPGDKATPNLGATLWEHYCSENSKASLPSFPCSSPHSLVLIASVLPTPLALKKPFWLESEPPTPKLTLIWRKPHPKVASFVPINENQFHDTSLILTLMSISEGCHYPQLCLWEVTSWHLPSFWWHFLLSRMSPVVWFVVCIQITHEWGNPGGKPQGLCYIEEGLGPGKSSLSLLCDFWHVWWLCTFYNELARKTRAMHIFALGVQKSIKKKTVGWSNVWEWLYLCALLRVSNVTMGTLEVLMRPPSRSPQMTQSLQSGLLQHFL